MPWGKRGERAGCGRWVPPVSGPGSPASADALSKYENSGAHGTDPPPGAPQLSSRWDGRLSM
ncbi:hypothetical protein FH965_27540 [Streptomyces spectabilis]|uniref:Uncharacterized protein n=1 Tax=Streptomyces spectabilis TaxID=68270 RepID=A0A516RDX7_STRST|nr:hypothetical protein FH965_27540 [Streptomyces spectabilis]